MKRLITSLLASWMMLASFAAAQASDDGCRFISAGDMGKALGTPVVNAKSSPHPTVTSCTYHTRGDYPFAIVTSSQAPSPALGPAEFSRITKMSADAFAVKPVALKGVGDQAVSITHVLWVRKGTTIFSINVVAPREPARVASAARAIALKLHP